MRRTFRRLCDTAAGAAVAGAAAAASPAAAAAPPDAPEGAATSPPPAGTDTATKKKASEPVGSPVTWRHLKPYPFRPASALVKEGCYFRGEKLGPRPLIVLPGISFANAGVIDKLPASIETVIDSCLATTAECPHGALIAPRSLTIPENSNRKTPTDPQGKSMFTAQCEAIAAMMDYHDINWGHFVCFSSGALMAIRMALEFPQRVGSITLIDSPVIVGNLVKNDGIRKELAEARKDVNVPLDIYELYKKRVTKEVRDGPCPGPFAAFPDFSAGEGLGKAATLNAALNAKLFGPEGYSEDGTQRVIDGYVSDVRDIISVRHPIQAIVPAKGAALDVNAHGNHLNLRKKVVVKEASNTAELLQGKDGPAAARAAIRQWNARWDFDDILAKRFEQARADSLVKAVIEEVSEDGGKGKKGKKGKK